MPTLWLESTFPNLTTNLLIYKAILCTFVKIKGIAGPDRGLCALLHQDAGQPRSVSLFASLSGISQGADAVHGEPVLEYSTAPKEEAHVCRIYADQEGPRVGGPLPSVHVKPTQSRVLVATVDGKQSFDSAAFANEFANVLRNPLLMLL